MTDKSVSFKNFVGAFIGGFLGILSSWYIHPGVLPVAVLLGVITGWWYQDVQKVFSEAHRKALETKMYLANLADDLIARLSKLLGIPEAISRFFRWLIARALIRSIVWTVTAPWRFWKWQKSSPRNELYVLEMSVLYFWMIAVTAAVSYVASGIDPGGAIVFGLLSLLFAEAGAICAIAGSHWFEGGENEDSYSLRRRFRSLELLSWHGPVVYFFFSLARSVRYTIGVLIFASICIPWFLGIAMASLILVYPIAAISVGFLELVKISIRKGHALCLVSTLATTLTSWLIFHEHFANPAILWSVALGTGIFSGLLTEGIRQGLLAFFEKTSLGKLLSGNKAKNFIFGPGESGGMAIMETVIEKVSIIWFKQNRPARLLRTVCFNTPVVKPVRI